MLYTADSFFNPSDPMWQMNIEKIKHVLKDDRIKVFILPSPKFKEELAKESHPLVQGMPPSYKAVILDGYGLLIQKKMVWDWISGDLEKGKKLKKNCYMLNNSDIRIMYDDEVIHDQVLKTSKES